MFTVSAQPILKYPFIFFVGFLVTYLLTPLIRKMCPFLGFMDIPDKRRIHRVPTARCGVSVFLGFHAACAAIFLIPWTPFGSNLDIQWWGHLLLLSSLLLLVGLFDDRFGLKAPVKLMGQIAVAALAFWFDMRVGKVLGASLPMVVDLIVTIFWFLAFMNAFNLIDGIDGLATGLAIIAGIGIAGSFMFRHMTGDALILVGFSGACLAFLRYNFQPASIFLGDSGSLFLGFILAAVALGTGAKGATLASVSVPLLAIGVPLFDTLLAVWRRTARRLNHSAVAQVALPGEGPKEGSKAKLFTGDTDHLHHRLIREGRSQRAVATWLYLLNAGLVVIGLLSMMFRSRAVGIYALAFVVGVYVIVRHLAKSELWLSAIAISEGLQRPPRRILPLVLYPFLDVLALSLALAAATYVTSPSIWQDHVRTFWFDQIPMWVGLPFLFLLLIRGYTRVWSRARLSEFLLVAVAVAAGGLIASGLSVVAGVFKPPVEYCVLDINMLQPMTIVVGSQQHHPLLIQTLVFLGTAIPLITLIRVFPRAVQDALAWTRLRKRAGYATRKKILLYGARYGAELFFIENSFFQHEGSGTIWVVGILDDAPELKGRIVHGTPVLGGIDCLEDVLEKIPVDKIILTGKLRADIQARLQDVAQQHGLPLLRWRTILEPLEPESNGASPR